MAGITQADVVLFIVAVVLFLVGVIGCIVPGLPGTPLCWGGLLCVSLTSRCTVSVATLAVLAVITIIVEIVNNIVPAVFTRRAGGSKEAAWGSVIGTFVGLLGLGVGVLLGAFLGAFIGELIHDSSSAKHALVVALWSFLGFITGVGLRLLTAAVLLIVMAQGFSGGTAAVVV